MSFEEGYYLYQGVFEDDSETHTLNHQCDMYRALLFAILEDKDSFDTYMKRLFDEYKSFCNSAKSFAFWSKMTHFDNIRMIAPYRCYFAKTLEKLSDLEKSDWALPWVIACAEYVHDCIKKFPEHTELMMYDWYKLIVEYAIESNNDGGAYFKYQSKVDEMSNKDYEIQDTEFE